MMPPVSLPLKGGTVSARTGAEASIPHMASRPKAPIIRIAVSISCAVILKGIGRHGKNAGGLGCGVIGSVAALHLTSPGLHGTVPRRSSGGLPHARLRHIPEKNHPRRRLRHGGPASGPFAPPAGCPTL